MPAERETTTTPNSLPRAALTALALTAQISLLIWLLARLGARRRWFAAALMPLALTAAACVCTQRRSPASKRRWVALLLILPLPGLCLYLLLGRPWTGRTARRFERARESRRKSLRQSKAALHTLERTDSAAAARSRRLLADGGFPVYRDTRATFHPQAPLAFEALKRELRQAKRFIFMEYHAVERSRCFREIEEILAERAAAGVEVRLLYDDVGSVAFAGPKLAKRLESRGIRCRVFNPMIPLARPLLNNRDHRKLTVIDGQTGFTGGYNLCDEYFGATHPCGHWKDTGLMLRGGAVRSLTAMFLEMWSAAGGDDMREDCAKYLVPAAPLPPDGWVQPFASSPLEFERLGERAYLSLIAGARHRLWIATPYLIPDDALLRELIRAARRGVDVRIVVPGIPDKRAVYLLTRFYGARLAREGARVFEYVPGFLHAKQLLADGESAAVGSMNLDYRSLYQHFEDAVLLHKCAAVQDIRRDFEATFPLCREANPRGASPGAQSLLAQSLMRLLAPLM